MDRKLSQNKCLLHQSEYFYYCETCNMNLCQDCAVFTHPNTTHQITRFNQSNKLDLKLVLTAYACLGKSLAALSTHSLSLNTKVERLRENFRKERNLLAQAQESMEERLESALSERLKKLEMKKNLVLNEKLILEKIMKTIQTEIDLSSQVQMIHNSRMLLDKIKEITSVPWSEELLIEPPKKFKSEVIPAFKTLTFTVEDFLLEDSCVNSPVLASYLGHWMLKVYPKGNGSSQGEYMSVFLQMVKGLSEERNYDFRIEMVNEVCELNLVKECSLLFKEGDCWGFSKFWLISHLSSGFLQNSSITFSLSVRPSSYKQLTSDQNQIISCLLSSPIHSTPNLNN